MITIKVSSKKLFEQKSDIYAVLCDDAFLYDAQLGKLADQFYPPLKDILEKRKFKGAAGSSLVVTGSDGKRPVSIVAIGLGSIARPQADRLEQCRRAAGQIIRIAEQLKVQDIALVVPDAKWFAVDVKTLAKEMTISFEMAAYHFDQFITDEARKNNKNYTITLCAAASSHEKLKQGIKIGQDIGHGVNQARHWCDLPPCELTPTAMAQDAKEIAQKK